MVTAQFGYETKYVHYIRVAFDREIGSVRGLSANCRLSCLQIQTPVVEQISGVITGGLAGELGEKLVAQGPARNAIQMVA
jgi:hypothetical protein